MLTDFFTRDIVFSLRTYSVNKLGWVDLRVQDVTVRSVLCLKVRPAPLML